MRLIYPRPQPTGGAASHRSRLSPNPPSHTQQKAAAHQTRNLTGGAWFENELLGARVYLYACVPGKYCDSDLSNFCRYSDVCVTMHAPHMELVVLC